MSASHASLAWLFSLVLALPGIPAAGQSPEAAITGEVLAEDGSPVAGAEVRLVGAGTSFVETERTRADGTFLIAGLEPGTYHILVSAPGYAPLSRELSLAAGRSTEVAFELPEANASGEITVTARRLEEDPKEVPQSVEVLPGTLLDQTDPTRLYELQFAVPGLVVNTTGMFGSGLSLRGVSSQGGTGTSVAMHMNGVYLGSSDLITARLFDLERIEVLKGPQGTLYGRNATGGTINLVSRSPDSAFDAAVEAAYGTFSTARAQGHVNLPFESGAVRLAFIASGSDGYIRNSVDERRFGEQDFWGVRGALRLYASDVMHVDLTAQHLRDDGASGELWTPNPGYLPNPDDIRLTNVTLADPYLVTEIDNVDLSLDWELGFGTLRSITGYAGSHVRDLDDCAGEPNLEGCVRGVEPSRYSQWSQEIQLLLPATRRLQALVGAQYFESSGTVDALQFIPLTNNPEPLNDSHSTSSEAARALFGQATLELARRWSATAGLRLSGETRRDTTIGTGVRDSPTLVARETDSDATSWRVDLQYAASDALGLYAGVSTGFKSGGLNPWNPMSGELDPFAPEHLTAYEMGMKGRWLDGRLVLDAAAFYYDFEDLQVFTVVLDDGRLVARIDNAAAAEVYGLDGQGVFRLTDRLTLSAGAVWLPKREFVRFVSERGDTFSGNDLARAPEWTTTAAIGWARPLRPGTLSARLEHSYRSGYFFTKENVPQYAQTAFGLVNAFVELEAANGEWRLFAAGRNLTDQDYFHQVFFQSSPGYPPTFELGAGYRF